MNVVYIVLNKSMQGYAAIIKSYEITHKANADGAELSIASLINNEVLIKINGIDRIEVLNRGTNTLRIFEKDENIARLTYYQEHKLDPDELL